MAIKMLFIWWAGEKNKIPGTHQEAEIKTPTHVKMLHFITTEKEEEEVKGGGELSRINASQHRSFTSVSLIPDGGRNIITEVGYLTWG